MRSLLPAALMTALLLLAPASTLAADDFSADEARAALSRAVRYFTKHIATEGGYLFRYSEDLSVREGERPASDTMVWVQPPGTPAVGLALLEAHRVTGNREYLDAARAAAMALVRGQLESGGWDYSIEFHPGLREKIAYRQAPHAAKGGANVTTLDDDNTQAAVRLLMRIDQQLEPRDAAIHEAALYALEKLAAAQYPNGAWPQRFSEPPDPSQFPVQPASYPATWPREWPKPKYIGYYTFNDNAMGDMIEVMFEAAHRYHEPKYAAAARRCGDFILLAQMPGPQPAWAQQYDAQMHPAWARKFEPPSVTGGESQSVIASLLLIYDETGDKKYLAPIGRALDYLEGSALPDGRLARFYELQTNKPLYFTRDYRLTYSDADVPTHYSFKMPSRLARLRKEYEQRVASGPKAVDWQPRPTKGKKPSETTVARARDAARSLDQQGRWLEAGGMRKTSDAKVQRVLTSETFIRNVRSLTEYLATQ